MDIASGAIRRSKRFGGRAAGYVDDDHSTGRGRNLLGDRVASPRLRQESRSPYATLLLHLDGEAARRITNARDVVEIRSSHDRDPLIAWNPERT